MELKNCRKAEIYEPEGGFLCEAEVTRASLDKYRLIVPADFELYESTGVYKVVFFDGAQGLIHTMCKLADPLPLPNEQQSLLCVVREETGKEQRRQDLKVPAEVSIEVACTRVPAGQKRVAGRIPATTRNISAGGIYFICEQQFPQDAHVQFHLHEASKPLQLSARVLRAEALPPNRDGAPLFGHGCRFVDLKPQAEAELRSFIFKKELEMRRRERGR